MPGGDARLIYYRARFRNVSKRLCSAQTDRRRSVHRHYGSVVARVHSSPPTSVRRRLKSDSPRSPTEYVNVPGVRRRRKTVSRGGPRCVGRIGNSQTSNDGVSRTSIFSCSAEHVHSARCRRGESFSTGFSDAPLAMFRGPFTTSVHCRLSTFRD